MLMGTKLMVVMMWRGVQAVKFADLGKLESTLWSTERPVLQGQ